MKFGNVILRVARKVTDVCGEHAPEICAVAGVVSMAAGVVVACKQTLKAQEVIEKAKLDIETIHEAEETCSENYSAEDAVKDKVTVYSRFAWGMVKTYAPVAILEAAGAILVLKGASISKKRLAGLSVAYEGLSKAFKAYRERVIADQGEDKDHEYMYGVKKLVEVGPDMPAPIEKTTRELYEENAGLSPYARIIDSLPGRRHVQREDPYYMRTFLQNVEDSANMILHTKRKLLLNEVYVMLGTPESDAGAQMGWTYVENGRNENGDNYIHFGINDSRNHTLLSGQEAVAWLDFNVDDKPISYGRTF